MWVLRIMWCLRKTHSNYDVLYVIAERIDLSSYLADVIRCLLRDKPWRQIDRLKDWLATLQEHPTLTDTSPHSLKASSHHKHATGYPEEKPSSHTEERGLSIKGIDPLHPHKKLDVGIIPTLGWGERGAWGLMTR